MTDDVAFASIPQLGAMMRRKSTSSVELTEFFLRRLERYGPKYNAVVTVTRERALREARRADAELAAGHDRGPLHGIPYGVKDLLATVGAPTTWGAAPYRHQVFDYDATVVRKLGDAGAVLLGKLAMIELAGGLSYNQADASFTGPCRNPWNTAYWTGGSSSGPGACVSAGLVPFAIGSETDGSIMNPSSFCGVSGLRPTYGRVSRHGAMALCWTLDKVGPMCRTAEDCATVLGAIAGADPQDRSSVDRPFNYPPPARGKWRVGLVKGALKKVQPEVRRNFEAALAKLHGVIETREIVLPKYPVGTMVFTILAAEAASAFRDIIQDGRVRTLQDSTQRHAGFSYFAVPAVDYVDAMRLRAYVKRALDKLFTKVDVIANPTESSVAWPIGVDFDKVYPGVQGIDLTSFGSVAGIPAISVPTGFGQHGLPTAMAITGPSFREAELVALAHEYQTRSDWHQRRPPA